MFAHKERSAPKSRKRSTGHVLEVRRDRGQVPQYNATRLDVPVPRASPPHQTPSDGLSPLGLQTTAFFSDNFAQTAEHKKRSRRAAGGLNLTAKTGRLRGRAPSRVRVLIHERGRRTVPRLGLTARHEPCGRVCGLGAAIHLGVSPHPYMSTAAPLGHTPYLAGGQRVRGAAPGDFFLILRPF